jgi:hypothetical protein
MHCHRNGGNIPLVPAFWLVGNGGESGMGMARKIVAAVLFAAIALGATACEFGEHRGSHSNVYPDDSRSSPNEAE